MDEDNDSTEEIIEMGVLKGVKFLREELGYEESEKEEGESKGGAVND
jgi:hypothetical protein